MAVVATLQPRKPAAHLGHGDIYRLLGIGHFRDRAGTGGPRDGSPVLLLHPQHVTLVIARLGQCNVTSQGASVCVTGGRVTSLCYEQAE